MYSSDAADQVVRISLEGAEFALKVTGQSAKHLAVILAAVMKEEQKTKGQSRLSSMIKSGKELKVFSLQQKDLKTFKQEAKRYGVLYCVLKDKNDKSPTAAVDLIARAEDASKIQRIVERFNLGSVDKAQVSKADAPAPSKLAANKELLSEKDLNSTGRLEESKKPSVREKLKRFADEVKQDKSVDLDERFTAKVMKPKERE